MKILNKIIKLNTKKHLELIDITQEVLNLLKTSEVMSGTATIFSKHTTSAIIINENETGLKKDIHEVLSELIKKERKYQHDDFESRICPEGERKNAWSHLQSVLLGCSQTVPIINNQLTLGVWQSIFFVELDGSRQNREVIIQIMGE